MYKAGEKVRYRSGGVHSQNSEIPSQERIGVIEESFSTIDNKPCYWIEGEKELILHQQIIGVI